MASVAYGTLPFREQIEFFRRKRNVLTESYLDVWETEHDIAFMVAGANRADLLADLRTAVDRVIAEGATLAEFRADFARIANRYGWDYTGGFNWRTRVIYETNLRQSYNAGRWAQIQRLKRVRPYLRYRHDDSVEHPRPIHESWDGLVLRVDDDWWLTHFPANGYGCQCYVEALSERDLRRLGKTGPDTAPPIQWVDVVVGKRSPGGPRIVRTPEGIDPGFAYAPGSSMAGWPQRRGGPVTPPSLRRNVERSAQLALDKTTRLPLATAAQLADEVLRLQRVIDAIEAGFDEWLAVHAAGRLVDGARYLVGAIAPGTARSLATNARIVPGTAAIAATADAVAPGWSAAEIASTLRAPVAVLREVASGALHYVATAARRESLVVQVRMGNAMNTIEAAGTVARTDLRAAVQAGRLQLVQGTL